jgi:hypothetical protein
MATYTGTPGNDTKNGTSSADTFNGMAGNDSLLGQGGDDYLDGGTGNDTLKGSIGSDTYVVDSTLDVLAEDSLDPGIDTVRASVSWTLKNYFENLVLTGTTNLNGTGNAAANTITGNDGANVLDGKGGNDVLAGGKGNDTYVVDSTGDVVTESSSQGTDLVKSSVTWALGPNVERLTLTGSGIINGTGNSLVNIITGNVAKNVLNGGGGSDKLNGGDGNDVLVWDAADSSVDGAGGTDTLKVNAASLDLASATAVDRVEILDLAGTVALTLAAADIAAVSGGTSLRVSGAAGDSVVSGGAWVQGGNLNLSGQDYAQYTSGALTLLVDLDIDRTGISLAPTGADATVATDQDVAYAFATGDFGFSDGNGGDTLEAVRIDALPASGILYLDGEEVLAGAVVSVTLIGEGKLVFDPGAGESGIAYASFTFSVQDSDGNFDAAPNTLTVDVAAAAGNNLPTGADTIVAMLEDASYALGAADFGFSDLDGGDTLQAVRIDSLPLAGTLKLSNVGVTEGQVIAVADLGNLVFAPAAGASGAGYASFTFSVQDSQNGYDETPDSVTFDVTAVNDAPAGANKTVTTNEDTAYTFTASDFGFSDASDSPANSLSQVKITTLPSAGTLSVTGAGALSAGSFVTVADINAGKLVFTPAANANGAGYAAFTFQVQDNGGTANSGANLDPSANTITLNVTAVNDAPSVSVDATTAYTIGAAGVAIDPTITLADIDSANLSGATVSVSNFSAGDTLAFTNQNGISGSYNAATGVLTLSGSASVANYETALESVKFSTTSFKQADRTISFTVTDGSATSAADTATLDIAGGVIGLAVLNGVNGLQFQGGYTNDGVGTALASAGDIDGDGFADFVVGVPDEESGLYGAGDTYVIFGQSSFAGVSDGQSFVNSYSVNFAGEQAEASSGFAVGGGGDVNGDGWDDFITAAPFFDVSATDMQGAVYVVFGKASPANAGLSSLNGTTGFQINGEAALDQLGRDAVAIAGDVNGDGYDDLLFGAWLGDPGARADAGQAYVVFGKSSFTSTLDLTTLNGTTGFQINGEAAGDTAGKSVSGAGDVNGDGFDDVFIAAYSGEPNGVSNSGAAYVIFGKSAAFTSNLELSSLNGTTGFEIRGEAVNDYAGESVRSAGDLNGDGFSDLIIGTSYADPHGGRSGAAWVVFGKSSFGSTLDLSTLNGTTGFQISGEALNDFAGSAVSGAGDLNGDGYDDLLIGATGTDVGGSGSGAAYVVFGKASGFSSVLELSALSGADGFQINGELSTDALGWAVSAAGDVNGDGFDDILLGAPRNDDFNGDNSGAAYLLFGTDFGGDVDFLGTSGANALTGTSAAEILVGGAGSDTLTGGTGNDVLKGAAGDDVLVFDSADTVKIDGGSGKDTLRFDGSGQSLNLTSISNLRYEGIEKFDLTGTGNNSLTLGIRDVLDLPDGATVFAENGKTQILVVGNAGDSVTSTGQGWVQGADTTIDGVAVHYYYHATIAAVLYIDTDLTATVT